MGRLRLCSWNIQFGRRLDLIVEAVRQNPEFGELDVLALQETSRHAGSDDASVIAACLGSGFVQCQIVAQVIGGHVQANALVWNQARLRGGRADSLELPRMASPEGVRRVEAYVLTRLRPQTRGGVVLEGRLDGALIRLYSVHLDVLGFAHKSRQLAAVLADHATRPRADLALIAGDLNTFGIANLPSWNALRTAARAAGFEDLTAGAGWTHSIRRLGLRQKLDAVLATTMTGLRHRSWTLPVDASDHLPLFVELSWP